MKYYLCKYIPPRADFIATMAAVAVELDLVKPAGAGRNLLDGGVQPGLDCIRLRYP
ncbi:hypothetical protein [Bradyrhizobium australiense]|uniref:hypothetical protein n=1 Tax=Bradyrhizobium australiense TaxID=2721161 RepID=UPI0014909433|nr:hypothetical protein [Bradyrhizobium australiense]